MKVAFLFRITESEDICDPGYTFRLSNGCKMGAVSCFMIYLARFRSKAATLGVMSDIFGFTDEIHSRVIKEFGFFIYSRFSSNAFRIFLSRVLFIRRWKFSQKFEQQLSIQFRLLCHLLDARRQTSHIILDSQNDAFRFNIYVFFL